MVTKDRERKALELIQWIVAELGESSYVGTALDGCLEIAEENIRNDLLYSMRKRLDCMRALYDMASRDAEELRKELRKKNDRLLELGAEVSDYRKELERQRAEFWEEKAHMKDRIYELVCRVQSLEAGGAQKNLEKGGHRDELHDPAAADRWKLSLL